MQRQACAHTQHTLRARESTLIVSAALDCLCGALAPLSHMHWAPRAPHSWSGDSEAQPGSRGGCAQLSRRCAACAMRRSELPSRAHCCASLRARAQRALVLLRAPAASPSLDRSLCRSAAACARTAHVTSRLRRTPPTQGGAARAAAAPAACRTAAPSPHVRRTVSAHAHLLPPARWSTQARHDVLPLLPVAHVPSRASCRRVAPYSCAPSSPPSPRHACALTLATLRPQPCTLQQRLLRTRQAYRGPQAARLHAARYLAAATRRAARCRPRFHTDAQ